MDSDDRSPTREQEPGGTDSDDLDDRTPGERDVGTTTGTFATVETRTAVDADTALDVRAVWLDDEPGRVIVRASVEGRRVELTLCPADARTFAEQVAEAARFATEGADE